MKQITDGVDTYHISKMRLCTKDDFTSRDISLSYLINKHLNDKERICPEVPSSEELY